MKQKIIVDSCCDMSAEMKNKKSFNPVPLTMMLGNKEFCDDENLVMSSFMKEVKDFSGKTGSASPSPFLYQEAIEKAGVTEDTYIVTLSSKLSGSYNNAVIGNNQAKENGFNNAYVFDSKSASAGETLIAIKIQELIEAESAKEQIVETINKFINEMKTYFVLENYDNLQKNGRLNKITGTIIQMLNIKLIMGADGNGEIALFEKCRGVKRMMQKILALVEKSGKDTRNENMVISHCNNLDFAKQLLNAVKEHFQFKNIYIVPTGGLSSLYADDKGIVFAF